MIDTLYEPFRKWSDGGSVWILSDTHFDDPDCRLMDPEWITPEEQVKKINQLVGRKDTFIHLGDVGNAEYVRHIHAGRKILLLGNHDRRGDCRDCFDEIYTGPLFIAEKILLSHEPVLGLPWCLNIHGHDHSGICDYHDGGHHLNLAANVCGYIPVNLGRIIQGGYMSGIDSIHRMSIDKAIERKARKDERLQQNAAASEADSGKAQ